MPKFFDGAEYSLKCPKCGHQFKLKLGGPDTKGDTEVNCPSCGVVLRYDPEELRAGDDDIANFGKDLKDFFKK